MQSSDALSLFSFGPVSSSYALTPASTFLFFLLQFWMWDNSSEITSITPASGVRWFSLVRILHSVLAARVWEEIQKTSPIASLKNLSQWGNTFECFGRSISHSPVLHVCQAGQASLAGKGKWLYCPLRCRAAVQSSTTGLCWEACRDSGPSLACQKTSYEPPTWLCSELSVTHTKISAFCCTVFE